MSRRNIPYATQWVDDDDVNAVVAALRSERLTQGPKVKEFEDLAAEYCGARYAVAVSSGTAALHIAALAAGFGPGDEVITSPITFAATANSVLYCGARPVFADIDPGTLCLDATKAGGSVNDKTRGIIPVHFAGLPCDMKKVRGLADEKGLIVIEDAAHALGASYESEGRTYKVGGCAHSDMTAFSFHAVKHITTGEGGLVTTNDEDLYKKLLILRTHGITRDESMMENPPDGPWYYEMLDLGFNYRITDFQCALGISQLAKLESFVSRRREIKKAYDDAFGGMAEVIIQEEPGNARSSCHLYVIQFKSIDRYAAFTALQDKGLGVNVHYIPVYRMPYYRRMGYTAIGCPESERYYTRAVSLPMFPRMSDADIEYVIESVKAVVRSGSGSV